MFKKILIVLTFIFVIGLTSCGFVDAPAKVLKEVDLSKITFSDSETEFTGEDGDYKLYAKVGTENLTAEKIEGLKSINYTYKDQNDNEITKINKPGVYKVVLSFGVNTKAYKVPAELEVDFIVYKKVDISVLTDNYMISKYTGEGIYMENVYVEQGILPEGADVSFSEDGKINSGLYNGTITFKSTDTFRIFENDTQKEEYKSTANLLVYKDDNRLDVSMWTIEKDPDTDKYIDYTLDKSLTMGNITLGSGVSISARSAGNFVKMNKTDIIITVEAGSTLEIKGDTGSSSGATAILSIKNNAVELETIEFTSEATKTYTFIEAGTYTISSVGTGTVKVYSLEIK